VVGFLRFGRPEANPRTVASFAQGLAKGGYVQGRNVAIEYRWEQGDQRDLLAKTADLVRRRVDVLVTAGGVPEALAAKEATSTIPVVMHGGFDPVRYGLVASLNRPGGNVTGVTVLGAELAGKRLGLLSELVPQAKKIAYFSGDSRRMYTFEEATGNIREAARALGREVIVLECRSDRDFEPKFAEAVNQGAGALIVGNFGVFDVNSKKFLSLAAFYKIPAIYPGSGYVRAGGLMSYNAEVTASYHQLGEHYVARILRGDKPADLPVQQPVKFELMINLKTANSLGLEVPTTLLTIADEVIE